jgi:beta-lactamase class A
VTSVAAPFLFFIKRSSWLVMLLLAMSLPCDAQKFSPQVESRIKESLAEQKGVFAVAFKDLSTGRTLFINEREIFHAASTMKTPVMIEIFKQSASGKVSLNDSILIRNEFKSIVDGSAYSLDSADDSEQELYKLIGTKRSLSALVYDMIIVSSNLATNLVIELADAKKVTQSMRDLGAKDMQVLRGVEDSKAFAKGLNNTTTAFDLMVLFERMARKEIVNTEASEAMINILLDQRFNTVIPARLPKDVQVAHKTGSFATVRHDCGIVFLPDGRSYVLVLLSKQVEDQTAVIEALATVSEMIYQEMVKK